MFILPSSQRTSHKILESVLEELYLSLIDSIQTVGEAIDLYSYTNEDILAKLDMLGLNEFGVGNLMQLDISTYENSLLSPVFIENYRNLVRNRGNKIAIDYILHTGNLTNNSLRSTSGYLEDNIFEDNYTLSDFSSYRDNQLPFLDIEDGYIIVPYLAKTGQGLRTFLAKNPLVFEFLPAGYTFIFLSSLLTGYNCGVLHSGNLYNVLDENSTVRPYWESYTAAEAANTIVEEIQLADDEFVDYTRVVPGYDDALFVDMGSVHKETHYPRYPYKYLYDIPLLPWGIEHEIERYNNAKDDAAVDHYQDVGTYEDLNNALAYADRYVGGILLPTVPGQNHTISGTKHVWGIQSIFNMENSIFSMYKRGLTFFKLYTERRSEIVSMQPENYGMPKCEIITDYQFIDCHYGITV